MIALHQETLDALEADPKQTLKAIDHHLRSPEEAIPDEIAVPVDSAPFTGSACQQHADGVAEELVARRVDADSEKWPHGPGITRSSAFGIC